MADKIIIKVRYSQSKRLTLRTPKLGSDGDMTDRTFAGDCDVDAILRKYGTINYKRFTSADCADISELPKDRLEFEEMLANVKAAHKEFGGDTDISAWLESLFKPKAELTEPKPTEPKPTEPKPTEPKPTEPKPTEPKE